MSVAKWIELSGELPTKTVPYVDGKVFLKLICLNVRLGLAKNNEFWCVNETF